MGSFMASTLPRYVFGESESGEELVVRLAHPRFVARVHDGESPVVFAHMPADWTGPNVTATTEFNGDHLDVWMWIDPPPASKREILALLNDAAAALDNHTDEAEEIANPDLDWN